MALSSILLVDDDAIFRERLAMSLRRRNYHVISAPDVATAKKLLTRQIPDMAVIDLKMSDADELHLVQHIHSQGLGVRMLVITGYGSIASAIEAIRLVAVDYLTKPADATQIIEKLLGCQTKDHPPSVVTPTLDRVEMGTHSTGHPRLRRQHQRGGAASRD